MIQVKPPKKASESLPKFLKNISGFGQNRECSRRKAGIAASGATYPGQLGLAHQRLAKASSSSGLKKQNTTKSLSSRRREYVSGDAEQRHAALGQSEREQPDRQHHPRSENASLGVAQKARQRILAVEEWEIAHILAVMLDEVEGIEDRGIGSLPSAQPVE